MNVKLIIGNKGSRKFRFYILRALALAFARARAR